MSGIYMHEKVGGGGEYSLARRVGILGGGGFQGQGCAVLELGAGYVGAITL